MLEDPRDGGTGGTDTPADEGTITVICGANSQTLPANYAGRTLGEVATQLREALNVPNDARMMVGGGNVENTYRLKAGDRVEFIRPTGRKG